jgi:hypothetical protein
VTIERVLAPARTTAALAIAVLLVADAAVGQ